MSTYGQWQAKFDAAIKDDEENHRTRHLFPVDWNPPGPPLHETQMRAYALLAAANLTSPNSRPNADDLEIWRNNVLRTAQEFEHYITGSENP